MEIITKKQYPAWVSLFARKYRSGSINQYLLHGNIHDLVQVKTGTKSIFLPFIDYLQKEHFNKANALIFYDRSRGIRFGDQEDKKEWDKFIEGYDAYWGTSFSKTGIPKNPVQAFSLLESYFRIKINKNPDIGVALIIEYAETLIPMANAANYSSEDRTIQVYLQRWAKDNLFIESDLCVVLITENIINLNQQYVKSPYTYEIGIPYPDESSRLDLVNYYLKTDAKNDSHPLFEMSPAVLAKNTAGLTLAHLRILLSEILENKTQFTFKDLNAKKKEIIEGEAGGLLEFVETKYSLKDVAGHKGAKKHLLETAQALKNGRNDVIPMGYLVAGPVGTGKTFLISCFSSDIGVPMVILKNFRSKYQGETEGNLEKVLHLLKAMTPVAVMIDEADAYLGQRNSEGDSGVSSRVFSMIASFMSNSDHRGKIIWFLVTARPDLMPVDFKRQGRAEEHLALFYPESVEEKRELFQIMLKKTGLKSMDIKSFDDKFFKNMTVNSGAEMEAALTRAKFRSAAEGKDEVSVENIEEAMKDFLPPTYPDEIELMNFAAVLECTSKALLPDRYRNMSRAEVVEKVAEYKRRVERAL